MCAFIVSLATHQKYSWHSIHSTGAASNTLTLSLSILYLVERWMWQRAGGSSTATGGGLTTTGGSRASTGSSSSRESVAIQATVDLDSAMIRLESKLPRILLMS